MSAAKRAGLDDEMSQRLWTLLTEEDSAAEPRPVSEADSRGYWSAGAADVAKAALWFPALDRWLMGWFRKQHAIPFGREIFDMITYGRAPCGFGRQDSPERDMMAEIREEEELAKVRGDDKGRPSNGGSHPHIPIKDNGFYGAR